MSSPTQSPSPPEGHVPIGHRLQDLDFREADSPEQVGELRPRLGWRSLTRVLRRGGGGDHQPESAGPMFAHDAVKRRRGLAILVEIDKAVGVE
jgi:hypothetical protein